MPQPTNLSQLGIGKETTRGTAVLPATGIPVVTMTPQDVPLYLDDKSLRGSMVDVFGSTVGPKHSTYDFAGPLYPDTFGFPLAGVLGDVTVTGVSAPYTHVMSTLNSTASKGQPPSYTISDYQVIGNTQARSFRGCQFSDVEVKFGGDGLLEYTAKAVGFASALITKPALSYSAVKMNAGWEGISTIGGSIVTNVESADFTIKRPVTVEPTVDGSQDPYAIFAGPVSVDGKATFIAEDETALTGFLAGTTTSLDFNFSQGSGSTLTQALFHMSLVQYTVGTVNRGKDMVVVDVTFSAYGNTTDAGASGGYSPIKATIQCAAASGTFA